MSETLSPSRMFQFAHAGGVRQQCGWQMPVHHVSIRARGGRATLDVPTPGRGQWFQFAHAGGVRLEPEAGRQVEMAFQFAHAGGVRPSSAPGSRTRCCFNSRTRGACDAPQDLFRRLHERFQFAHAGGVRRRESRTGCETHVSIRARGGRATSFRFHTPIARVFQFAHAGGVRPGILLASLFLRCFNSRTRGACDHGDAQGVRKQPVSIRARGGRAT